jgi:hypothetical protein
MLQTKGLLRFAVTPIARCLVLRSRSSLTHDPDRGPVPHITGTAKDFSVRPRTENVNNLFIFFALTDSDEKAKIDVTKSNKTEKMLAFVSPPDSFSIPGLIFKGLVFLSVI